MRKVVVPKLSQKEKDGIKVWLRCADKIRSCPFVFAYGYGSTEKCEICYKMFPRLTKHYTNYVECCPCAEYKLNTVIKRAREVLKCQS